MNLTDKNVNPNFSGVTTGGEYATLNSPKPISVTGLNENVKPYVPPSETPTPNYSGIAKTATDVALSPSPTITSPNGAVLDINGNIITPAKTDTTSSSESIQEKTNKILAGMGVSTTQPTQKSFADQYKELTGIDPNTLSRERINNLAKVNELSVRLKALDAQALKNQEDAMKQGETLGFASREAQNIARTDAIERLAVSSELNAYQGRLESAQADIRTLLDLTYKDEQLKTERADKAYERAYAIATNEEKKELDKLKTENDAKKEENQNLFTLKQTYIKQALDNGDYKTASEIATATTNEQLQQIAGGMTQQRQFDTFTQDGVTYQAEKDPITGQIKTETIRPLVGGGTSPGNTTNDFSLAKNQANINELDNLLKSGGLSSSVGTSFLTTAPKGFWGAIGRVASVLGIPSAIGGTYRTLTGERQNFIAGVEQVRSNLNLETLIKAKSQGATFGALSDQELKVLASAGTKMGTWAVKNKNGDIVGYNASEKDFRTELDKINNFAKLDYLLKGGAVEEINGQVMQDGTVWVENSDGTLTKIYPR